MSELFNTLMQIDANLLLWIQENVRSAELTPVMQGFSTLGNAGIFWIAVSILLMIPKRTRRAGIISLASIVVTFCICNLWLKNAVARVRPYEVINGLEILIDAEDTWSFPSGHAASSFAASVAILRCAKKWLGIPCVCVAALIAFSRLYVGVHYPSDVIGGIAIGLVVALVLSAIFRKREEDGRRRRRARR